jgi:hypothetical protein
MLNLLTWLVIDSILKTWKKNLMLPGLAIPGFIIWSIPVTKLKKEVKSENSKQINHPVYSGFA